MSEFTHKLAIFIGGPVDGDSVEDSREPVTKRIGRKFGEAFTAPNFTEHLYYRERFQAGDPEFIFYRHESLSLPNMVERLINNYTP